MNSRLSASVSTLFSGKQRRFFSREILICLSNVNLLNGKCRSFGSFQHQRFEAPRRAVNNSYSEDDFSESGPAVADSAASRLKLVTEKPEPSLKTASASKPPVSSFQSQGFEASRRVVHNFSSQDDFSELGPPVSGSDVTQLKLVTQKPEPFVKTDPAGKASTNSNKGIQKAQFGLYKNSESSGRDFPNQPLHDVKNVTIRIQGIAKETTDPVIHSICKSTGVLEGFARAGTGSVDALFRVTNDTDAQGIVQRLNDIVVKDCHWSANQISKDLSSATLSVSEEGGSKLGIRINNTLTELRKQFDYKRTYFEDLQSLHMGIMHLEGIPTISHSFPEDKA